MLFSHLHLLVAVSLVVYILIGILDVYALLTFCLFITNAAIAGLVNLLVMCSFFAHGLAGYLSISSISRDAEIVLARHWPPNNYFNTVPGVKL